MSNVTPSQPAPAGATPVELISALMDAERVTPDAPEATPEPEAQPEGDAEAPAENAQIEGDDAEPEKGAVAEIPLDQLEAIELEVTYKGDDGRDVTEKLPVGKIKEGFMRQADYQRKTAEVARQREQAQELVRQGVAGERAQYLQQLQSLEAVVMETAAAELKNVNWNDLAQNNPFEWTRLQNRQMEVNNTLNSIRAKQTETRTKMDVDQRLVAQTTAQKTWATLQAEIPGWNEQVYQEALKAGEAVGYTATETAQWLDAKAIKLLHKLSTLEKLQASKPNVDKKVVNVPKVVKPGATPASSPQATRRNEALQRLNKSGRVDDLAALLAQGM